MTDQLVFVAELFLMAPRSPVPSFHFHSIPCVSPLVERLLIAPHQHHHEHVSCSGELCNEI